MTSFCIKCGASMPPRDGEGTCEGGCKLSVDRLFEIKRILAKLQGLWIKHPEMSLERMMTNADFGFAVRNQHGLLANTCPDEDFEWALDHYYDEPPPSWGN